MSSAIRDTGSPPNLLRTISCTLYGMLNFDIAPPALFYLVSLFDMRFDKA